MTAQMGAAHFHIIEKGKVPQTLLTSGSILFLLKSQINRKLIHSLAEDPGLIASFTLIHSNLE